MNLKFDEKRHEYWSDGILVPSVTEILKPICDLSRIPQPVLDAARMRGTFAHQAIEYAIDGSLDRGSVSDDIAGILAGFERWQAEEGAKVLKSEAMVFHAGLWFAGRVDLLAEVAGQVLVIDIKTTANVEPHHRPQTAAYQKALEFGGQRIDGRGCLYLGDDATWQYVPHDDPDDWRCFLALLTLKSWRAKHGVA